MKMRLLLAIVLVSVGLCVWQRNHALAWWKVRQLAQANEAEREERAKQVADLGPAALPHLVRGLDASAEACSHLEIALQIITESWSLQESRGLELQQTLQSRFGGLSQTGKGVALRLLSDLCARVPHGELVDAAAAQRLMDMLQTAQTDTQTRPAALMLAGSLAPHASASQFESTWRTWADAGLASNDSATRLGALHLVLKAFPNEKMLLAKTVPLLKDGNGAVRKGALLALGNATDVIGDDDLLDLLHDEDLEVQAQCERVLRGRGLHDRHLHLARLITDPRPATRCEVVRHLFQSDVDAGAWLRRLSQDTAPSVRATAARAASLRADVDLRAILRDMSTKDPSPTVRELAGHFLQQQ